MDRQSNKVKPEKAREKCMPSEKGILELGPYETGDPQVHDKAFSREKTWTR